MLPPAQVLAHPSVYLCGGGWLFFVAENAVLSENRQVFIDRLGDRGYKSCYGLLSTCSLASVAYGARTVARCTYDANPCPGTGATGPWAPRPGKCWREQETGRSYCHRCPP